MKFEWSNADKLALALTVGDRIEYRKRGIFSFSATKWAVCLETKHESLNNNLSPIRAKHVRVIQMTKNGDKIGTMSLEEFIGEGQGRINNIHDSLSTEVKSNELFPTTAKSVFRRFREFVSDKLHRFRMFMCKNRKKIFTAGTGLGLMGIVVSIAGLSITAAVITSLVAGSTLMILYLDPYHKRVARVKRPSSRNSKQPIASRYIRTPARFTYSRKGGYRSL